MRNARYISLSLFALIVLFACGNSSTDPTPVPPTPSVLAGAVNGASVALTWTEYTSTDFANYILYRSLSPGIAEDTTTATPLAVFNNPDEVQYTDVVTQSGTYFYCLRTQNEESLVAWSNEISAVITLGGGVPDVTGFEVDDAASNGQTVVLNWIAVTTDCPADIDGYKLYFREDNEGTYFEIADIDAGTTTYSHTASSAGGYAIEAYEGDDVSANVATANTLPILITATYTIWNNHCPADSHGGFIFGQTSGTTGSAPSTSFAQDIYCYDNGQGNFTWFFSGDYGTFGNGNHTDMYEHASGYSMPTGSGWTYGGMIVGDVIFGELFNGYWVKIYVDALPHYEGGTANAYGIQFYYDYQPIQGLYLFTTDAT